MMEQKFDFFVDPMMLTWWLDSPLGLSGAVRMLRLLPAPAAVGAPDSRIVHSHDDMQSEEHWPSYRPPTSPFLTMLQF